MHFINLNFLSNKLPFLVILFPILLSCQIVLAETTRQQPVTLTFALVPQQSATKLAIKWGPVLKYLSDKTGYKIEFKTAKNIPIFEERCSAGEYDIAYMNPYHYIHFHNSPGYNVFAREDLKALKGILVVQKDSPYQEFSNFSSTTLAFPSPAAFAASIVTRAKLSALGIPFTPQYVASHDSVYKGVAKGLFPAGGGIPRTFNNLDKETKDQLQIFWTSKEYTPHAFAAHPRISKEIVTTLQQAMLQMATDPEGKKLLEKLSFKNLVAAEDSEWDDIRALEIRLLSEKSLNK